MRTLDFHQRIVLLHFEASFVLALLAQQVGHDCLVVRYAHAKRYGDGLTPAVVAGRVVADRSVLDLLPRRVGERNRTQTYQQQHSGCRERRRRNTRSARHRVDATGRLAWSSQRNADNDGWSVGTSGRVPIDGVHFARHTRAVFFTGCAGDAFRSENSDGGVVVCGRRRTSTTQKLLIYERTLSEIRWRRADERINTHTENTPLRTSATRGCRVVTLLP